MAQYGLLLRVTHTGKAGDSVHVSDIRDGVDILASFRKAGPVYVPAPAKGGQALLVYSGDVAISFETGGIRKFIEGGYLTAEFVIGDTFAPDIFPETQDEGALVESTTQVFNFTGAGVTATQTVPGVIDVNVPGGSAGGDHTALTNLLWTSSGHTGTANQVAGFDGTGATAYYQIGVNIQAWGTDLDALAALATTGILSRTGAGTYSTRTIMGTAGNITVTDGDGGGGNPVINIGANVLTTSSATSGDVSGTLPGPLMVTDLTITSEVQGSVLYFNGSNWVSLPPGAAGEVLSTGGIGADPSWTSITAFSSSQMLWGNNSIGGTTTTRYLAPGEEGTLAQTVPIQIRCIRAGTFRNLRVRHNVTAGNGNPITYTLRVNGVATALTATVNSTATDGSDLVNSVVVAAGDLLDIVITKSSSVGSSPNDVVATVEFV